MISIDQLVRRPGSGLTLLAGHEGQERIVTWAHAVDLPDPWQWVRQGDLLMTTGAGMPTEADAQVEWVARLVDASISGLVVAAPPGGVSIGPGALALADERRFPILGASFDLEFSTLARVVIESALESQRHRLASSERLFSAYVAALREGGSLTARLDLLGHRFGWHLEIQHGPAEAERPGAPERSAKGDANHGDAPAVRMTIPGRGDATLIVRARDRLQLETIADPLVVHYLSGILAVELEREAIDRDQMRTDGEETLRAALTGDLDLSAVRAALRRRGTAGPLVAVAVEPRGHATWTVAELHHHPHLHELSPLLLADGATLLAVLPQDDRLVEGVRRAVGNDSRAGVSGTLNTASGLLEGARQARLALARAAEFGSTTTRYDTDRPVTLLPATVAESAELARRHLGPLLAHDASHGTDLVATVAAFLANDGRWKLTAEQLHVHRQTLVYRLKVVEDLTGLKPTSTAGTTALWVALQAGRAAGLVEDVALTPHTVV